MKKNESSNRLAIVTKIGEIRGRDAIYLDKVTTTLNPLELGFKGSFNAALCDAYDGEKEFIDYDIRFSSVREYRLHDNKNYDSALARHSSFDVVLDENDSRYNMFIFSTYDYTFEIFCEDYILDFIE